MAPGCPARFLSLNPNILPGESHGIDSTRIPAFGDVTGPEGINTVRELKSVFHSILKLVPWDEFERAIKKHNAQEAARSFTHRSHLIAMLYAQFAGVVALRDIEAGLASHANRLYLLHDTQRSARPSPKPTPTARSRSSSTCWRS
jgi:hypothetical protein